MSLSPEREQQIRDYLEGCQGACLADIPEQFRRYERWLIESDERATVLLAELDRVRAELAQARACGCYPNPYDHEESCPVYLAVVPAAGEANQ